MPPSAPCSESRDLWQVALQIPNYDPRRDAEGYFFDAEEAGRIVNFIETALTHVKGELAGQPLRLETWQLAVVVNLFGWRAKDTGYRRFRECLLYIPRKNGKTTISSAVANALLFVDGEPGAEIYCAAADTSQAEQLFSIAKVQVLRQPALKRVAKVYRSSIAIEAMGSFLKVISSEADTKHGQNAHGVVVDELHAQADRRLVDVLSTGVGSRRQPLILYITTADYERAGSICNEKHDYATRVRDGLIRDPQFLPVIYEAGKTDDWTSPEVWRRANPNLGISLKLEYVERECRKAQHDSANENTFKRLQLNIRTSQIDRWLPLIQWDACKETFTEGDLAGRECFVGIDLSSHRDLTACVLAFPEETNEAPRFYVLPYFWAPAKRAEQRQREERVPYQDWIDQGFLRVGGHEAIDQQLIFRDIVELLQRFRPRKIFVDPWQARAIMQALEELGYKVEEFRQVAYVAYNAPSKLLEASILDRRLVHNGHPILRWNADNVTRETDGVNIRPSKKKSTDKIDGITALIAALSGLTKKEDAPGYRGKNLFVLG